MIPAVCNTSSSNRARPERPKKAPQTAGVACELVSSDAAVEQCDSGSSKERCGAVGLSGGGDRIAETGDDCPGPRAQHIDASEDRCRQLELDVVRHGDGCWQPSEILMACVVARLRFEGSRGEERCVHLWREELDDSAAEVHGRRVRRGAGEG